MLDPTTSRRLQVTKAQDKRKRYEVKRQAEKVMLVIRVSRETNARLKEELRPGQHLASVLSAALECSHMDDFENLAVRNRTDKNNNQGGSENV
jgi:hypothetical protein